MTDIARYDAFCALLDQPDPLDLPARTRSYRFAGGSATAGTAEAGIRASVSPLSESRLRHRKRGDRLRAAVEAATAEASVDELVRGGTRGHA